MKKYVLPLLLSALFANHAQAAIGTGFYAGINTGYMNTSAHGTHTVTGGGNTSKNKTDFGRHRPHIGLFLGYGFVSDCLYTGYEFGYSYEPDSFRSQSKDTLTGVRSKIKLHRRHNLSGNLRFGYLFNQSVMGYVRAGLSLASHKRTLKSDSTTRNAGTKRALLPAVGLGMDASVAKNVFIRTEWTYGFGTKVRVKKTIAGSVHKIKMNKMDTQKFTLGVAYRF